MANNFIDTVNVPEVIGTAYDSISVKELRPNYIFDALSQEKKWNISAEPKKGDAVYFNMLASVDATLASLDATNDDISSGAETLSYTRQSVSLDLHGRHAVVDTLELTAEEFVDTMVDAGWAIADQAMASLNLKARRVWDLNIYSNEASGTIASTYTFYGSQGTASNIGALKSVDVREVFAQLKSTNVKPYADGYYRWVCDPVQIQQLRGETGNGAWRDMADNTESGNALISQGAIGMYEGFVFISNSTVLGNGTGTISSYAIGAEAVGKAVGKDVSISANRTMRGAQENLAIIKWNALIGYKVVRRSALLTVITDNSVA